MWSLIFFFIFAVVAEEDFRVVKVYSGLVSGNKYWNGDYYEFYGIPYATAPTGRDRFKAPLPVTPWDDVFSASNAAKRCRQCYHTDADESDVILDGDDDCLIVNILVPTIADNTNLVPVLVYIHSGAYAGGSGNMAKFNFLVKRDIIIVSFNYRVGALGFACLGNEDIPGNAALYDQLAALRWIKSNIENFGGDPDKITLAGFSVGAAMAELLTLSKATDGLFNQLILESGSALSPFTINRDPVSTAWNIAQAMGYNGTENIEELTEFYLNVDTKTLMLKSLNFFLPNSTFGFAPCIERDRGLERVVTESPLDTFKKGDFKKIPVLTGFSNMEGISRTIKFGSWREEMNENFDVFLPADLQFKTTDEKNEIIKEIKKNYFKDKVINHESLQDYINYFSDAMFKYSIIKSAKFHTSLSNNAVYLYEFSYVGKLNVQHKYMDRIKGASHRDQTAYLLDFYGSTNNYKDLTTRDRMTTMWTDFAQYGNPTEFESLLISVKWPPHTNKSPNYLEINRNLHVKQGLFTEAFKFWDKIYEKYYWNPTTVKPEIIVPKEKKSLDSDKVEIKTHRDTPKLKAENIKDHKETEKVKEKQHDEKSKEGENVPNGSKDNNQQSNLKKTTTLTKRGSDGKLFKVVIKENEQGKEENKNEAENIDVIKIKKTVDDTQKNKENNEKYKSVKKTKTVKPDTVDKVPVPNPVLSESLNNK